MNWGVVAVGAVLLVLGISGLGFVVGEVNGCASIAGQGVDGGSLQRCNRVMLLVYASIVCSVVGAFIVATGVFADVDEPRLGE